MKGFRFHIKTKGAPNILKQENNMIKLLSLKYCIARVEPGMEQGGKDKAGDRNTNVALVSEN